jgi:hypothetical protein
LITCSPATAQEKGDFEDYQSLVDAKRKTKRKLKITKKQ